MGTKQIRSGQKWLVDLHGQRLRVLVVASHTEFPDTWICERLSDAYETRTGPHILVRHKNFLSLEEPDQSSRE
jgi:hypothetical protein